MERLLGQLSAWKRFNALVVGDFMLDQHVYGDAERLSADAPVPILHVRRTESRAGGAANVCMDLAALGGEVWAFGVVGGDDAGRELKGQLEKGWQPAGESKRAKANAGAWDGKIHAAGVTVDGSRPTTVKQNLVGLAQTRHPQKMFRVDYESREGLGASVVAEMCGAFDRRLGELAGGGAPLVVCIEDYAKGVCTEQVCQHVISRCAKAGVPVFVDPARMADYSRYRGATVITPNRTEAELAAGISTGGDGKQNSQIAAKLLGELGLEAVVLTLDRDGALLLMGNSGAGDSPATQVPTVAREVYDVTGAGDMFLAGLAAARANGFEWEDSVRFANAAAGLEVEVFGVQPMPFERVHHSLLMQGSGMPGKLRTWEQVALEAKARRAQGKSVVFTNGCFDVLHSGHVTLLEKAAGFGDFLVVGLNDDASVGRLKGPGRPVNNQDDRARVLGALGCVGAVVLFGEDTPLEIITALRPDVLVKGADYKREQVVGGQFVESCGGRVELVGLVEGKSTTATIGKMRFGSASSAGA